MVCALVMQCPMHASSRAVGHMFVQRLAYVLDVWFGLLSVFLMLGDSFLEVIVRV